MGVAEAESLTIIEEYAEFEIGKGADALDRRPQLAAAPGIGKEGQVQHSRFQAGPAFPRCCVCGGLNGPTRPLHRC
jgi:hypothetical protein